MQTERERPSQARNRSKQDVDVPGGEADRPSEIPARGWKQILKRGWKEAKADQVPLLSAGVAFYAFLAIFPALIAIVSLYGLFADPATITAQLNSLTEALPAQARQVITDQVTALTARRSTLGIGLIISVAIALWSASGGVSNLITAINAAYDEEEKRNFVKKRLLSLGMTAWRHRLHVDHAWHRRRTAPAARTTCSGAARCAGFSRFSAGS